MTDLDEKCPNCSSINPNLNNSSSSNNITMKQPKIKKKKSVCFITFIILAVIAIIAGITTGPSSEYYISSSNNLFYYSGSDWWNYNTQDKDWNQYNGKLVNKRPLELKKDYRRYIDASAVAGILSIQDVDSVDIFRSHNYLDVHPQKPLETYYKKDGKIYYFLNDIYGSN